METHPVGGSRRALIVDDDPMVGVLLKDLVASFGFTTRRARTVSEALKKLWQVLTPMWRWWILISATDLAGWILLAY